MSPRAAAKRQTTAPAEFAPIRVEPAYRKVAAALLERITDRSISAGDRLPPEIELARQFGVHRGTVREALRELETNGVLKRERGSKLMMVTRPARVTVAAGVSRALALHDVSYHDVWEALTALEPPIAAAAARHRTAADIKRLEATVAEPAGVEQTAKFFALVGEATHNGVFMLAHEPLVQLLVPQPARHDRQGAAGRGTHYHCAEAHHRGGEAPGSATGRGLDGEAHPRLSPRLRNRRNRARAARRHTLGIQRGHVPAGATAILPSENSCTRVSTPTS